MSEHLVSVVQKTQLILPIRGLTDKLMIGGAQMNSLSVRSQVAVSLLMLCISWTGPDASSAATEIENIPRTPHLAPLGTPPADLAAAIIRAGHSLNWQVMGDAPGRIVLKLFIRSHSATVAVGYDPEAYWIDYMNSSNLGYRTVDERRRHASSRLPAPKRPSIHRNYNRWVNDLSSKIALSLMTPPRAVLLKPAPSDQLILIAEELERLDALRVRGILTQEEFDGQKSKLLAR
ncbi:MAG TPA: SHOCT domain-containing protein [Myxococcales bacterium]|nr:SHOCT domain-containing protein [Myxococcales bacterium]